MSNEEAEEGSTHNTVPAVISQSSSRLLPGIHDEITLDHIVPKLSWRTIYTLSAVSHAWQQAIQCNQVYDARVRSHSRDTLVVINHLFDRGGTHAIGLYSKKDTAFYQLPQIPHQQSRIYGLSQCVSLDGKIYVLGGVHEGTRSSNAMYVMDLAAQRQWVQCASMQYPRHSFACGVLDGKIYVFGGSCYRACSWPVYVDEVYDPKLDIWSPVKSMTSVRIDHRVTTVGDELFVYGGKMFNPAFFDGTMYGTNLGFERGRWEGWDSRWDVLFHRLTHDVDFLEIYHAIKDEWRKVKPFGRVKEYVFFAEGKFHSMSSRHIYVHDMDKNSWSRQHEFSLTLFGGEIGNAIIDSWTTLAVEDELLTIVSWRTVDRSICGECLLQSEGFGGRDERIVWNKLRSSFLIGSDPSMCLMQL